MPVTLSNTSLSNFKVASTGRYKRYVHIWLRTRLSAAVILLTEFTLLLEMPKCNTFKDKMGYQYQYNYCDRTFRYSCFSLKQGPLEARNYINEEHKQILLKTKSVVVVVVSVVVVFMRK